MTVALPLSAVRMWMELSRRMSCKAESSPLERLGLAGLALRRTSLICSLTSSAAVLLSRRRVGSTDWMISYVGMYLGVRAKFIPSDSTDVSMGVRVRWLRLTTVCFRNASCERRCEGCLRDIADPVGVLGVRLE